MRKRTIKQSVPAAEPHGGLALDEIASVEVTSEDPAHPIEQALLPGSGWVAGEAGPQLIRIVFDEPQHVRRIQLVFRETDAARTQEFVLRWGQAGSSDRREIVRQQWNFSPPGATEEVEDYTVDLKSTGVLELSIIPNISGGNDRASLRSLRLT
jgi:hypothetical protein